MEKYEEIRYFLFVQTYVASQLINKLRKKYKIKPEQTYSEWISTLIRNYWNEFQTIRNRWQKTLKRNVEFDFGFFFVSQEEVEKKALPEISIISKELDINEGLFRIFLLYDNVPKKLVPPRSIYYANELRPIVDEGHYIKVDNETTWEDLRESFKKVKDNIKLFYSNKKKIIKNKKKYITKEEDYEDIKIFFEVELSLIKLVEEKRNNLYEKSYSGELVRPSIERVVGNILEKKYGDKDWNLKEEKKLYKKINNIYRKVIRKYKLPTPKKLTSILELTGL